MKDYKVILFDLDGTITDPGEGITKSVAYALEKFGIKNESRENLNRFIGPPLWYSFETFYGLTKDEADEAVEYYRERYVKKGINECELIDGVVELIKELKSRGKTLLLATSKPEVFARVVIENYKLTEYFDFIGGATKDKTRSEKADIIAYSLKCANVKDKEYVVMIGDREHDILGAKEQGIDSIGVNCGYGSIEEFKQAGADYIFENMAELFEAMIF